MIKLVVNIGILLLLLSQVQTETVYSYLFRSFMNQLMFTHTDTLTDMHILTVTTIQLLHLHPHQHQSQLEPQFLHHPPHLPPHPSHLLTLSPHSPPPPAPSDNVSANVTHNSSVHLVPHLSNDTKEDQNQTVWRVMAMYDGSEDTNTTKKLLSWWKDVV